MCMGMRQRREKSAERRESTGKWNIHAMKADEREELGGKGFSKREEVEMMQIRTTYEGIYV